MNVIEGQANRKKKFSLIFYSLTFNNILNIIVMLILVGVTINVALNGGIFGKANNAAKQMEEKTIYEQIVGAMQLTNAGKIDVKGTYEAAKTDLESQGKTVTLTSPAPGAEITDATASITFEVKGKNGIYTYTITTEDIKIEEDFNVYGVCYTDKDSLGFEMYLFKCGVLIQKFPWGDGIVCYNGAIFENNEIRLNGFSDPLGWGFTGDFSSCEFSPTGEGSTEYVRTEKQYNYEPTKNGNLGIYTNNAIYLSSESVMWIDADAINFWTATGGMESISISGVETPEALQTAITNKGYDNMVISNDGETITFQKGEASIEYNLIKKEELK